MGQPIPEGFDIGRLAAIPHGDAALALGKSSTVVPPAVVSVPAVNGLPIGVRQDLTSGYLEPYKFFQDNPFKGNVTAAGFPGFNPVAPHELLQLALDRFKTKIKKTTILDLDTTNPTGGIHNIPFVVTHANAASMKSTFWIHELTDRSLRLQYLQIVLLDFFPRRDGLPGRISWPHVSINTLTKASSVPYSYRGLTEIPR